MDLKSSESLHKPSFPPNNQQRSAINSYQPFTRFGSPSLSFGTGASQDFTKFSVSTDHGSLPSYQTNQGTKAGNHLNGIPSIDSSLPVWDPRTMLNNLAFLEQKIHQVQDIVRSIVGREGRHAMQPNELAAQQQLLTADLTSIIIQLISTAGTLLPSIKNTLISSNPSAGQLESIINSPSGLELTSNIHQNEVFSTETTKISKYKEAINLPNNSGAEMVEPILVEDHDMKDYDDGGECENLPAGSYEVLQLEKEEILAPHTHFCPICGKGFKRDANLRMHMRGHGDEYKSPAALAKPTKESNCELMPIKRYSCPFIGCKRNKEHKKFQPLKTILCVKNHYKRSHCDKSYTCSRCNSKKFSVIADLKTHEKHCGRDKWLCSCGTTFSRKDKLFGHVALFQGHTPALPNDENRVVGTSSQMPSEELMNIVDGVGFSSGGNCLDDIDFLDIKGIEDDPSFYTSGDLDSCNFEGFHEFPRPPFQVSEDSFPFMPSMPNDYEKKNGGKTGIQQSSQEKMTFSSHIKY